MRNTLFDNLMPVLRSIIGRAAKIPKLEPLLVTDAAEALWCRGQRQEHGACRYKETLDTLFSECICGPSGATRRKRRKRQDWIQNPAFEAEVRV